MSADTDTIKKSDLLQNPPNSNKKNSSEKNFLQRVIVFVAQGFGSGLAPLAPGTWGTLVGVALVYAMLQMSSIALYFITTAVSVLVSIIISDKAEKILGETDPGSVVIDEIIAMPICWAGPVLLFCSSTNIPFADTLFANKTQSAVWMAVSFGIFRLLDIWKPWPAHQIQNLHGGLGVTLDDVISAVYSSILLVVLYKSPILI